MKSSSAVLGCRLYRKAMRDIVDHHYRRMGQKKDRSKSRREEKERNGKRRKAGQASGSKVL
jgi:hypothetical protein